MRDRGGLRGTLGCGTKQTRRRPRQAFSLIECMFSVAIVAIVFLGTLSLLGFAQMHNAHEQERTRAHEIVSQYLEVERHKLFTWTASAQEQTVWDNGTVDDTSDDTIGILRLIVRDPATGTIFAMAPNPAQIVELEAIIVWRPRGRMAKTKVMHESAITYDSP